MSKIRRTIRDLKYSGLVRNEEGAVTPLMAMTMITALGALGGAVDMSRYYLAQTQLQAAVDAATLAGGRTLRIDAEGSDTIEEGSAPWTAVQEYFLANFPEGYLGSQLNPLVISGNRSGADVTVNVEASGTIDATFARILGMQTLDIYASSSAETSRALDARPAEVMLVLDNTGSMASNNRIGEMKGAVGQFLEVVYGEHETQSDIAIGVLPYNTMVNVGKLVEAARPGSVKSISGFTDNSSEYGWKGCVFADETVKNLSSDTGIIDSGAWDIGKAMPGDASYPGQLGPFYYPPINVDSFQEKDNRYTIHPDLSTANSIANSYRPLYQALVDHYNDERDDPGQDNEEENGVNDITVNNQQNALGERRLYLQYINGYSSWPDPVRYDFRDGISPKSLDGHSPNYQCPTQAKPISYDYTRSQLSDYVKNENTALNPGTGTFHNVAMSWAYRLLARDDVFLRQSKSEHASKRYIVFMTDGNFDSRDRGREDVYGNHQLDTAYTAYGTYRDEKVINGTSRNDTIDALALRFSKTCEAAKEEGIEIYTIAFEISKNDRGEKTRQMFRDCSSNAATHFFDAANGNDLSFAYRAIASDLTELHLSK